MMFRRPKIGLALGGGGARGLSHIGVLKVLEAAGVPIDMIAGTSIGALVGGCYALHPDAIELERRVREYIESPEFKNTGLDRFKRPEPAENFFGQVAKYVRERIVINLAHSRLSVVGADRMGRVVEAVLDDRRIEDTKIPLLIVATDLHTGDDCIMREGSLREAAMASAAIPGFLPPVQQNGHLLVDGAVTAPVPVRALQDAGMDVIIAVDVGQDIGILSDAQNIVDIMFRTNSITSHKLKTLLLETADVVVRPDVGGIHWADFQNIRDLIEKGEQAANEQLRAIRHCIREKQPFWQRLFTLNRYRESERQAA